MNEKGLLMNKKYVNCGVVAVLLTMHTVSFSMKTNLMRYVAGSALVGGGCYLMDKEIAKYEESTLKNVPCHVEKWARKNLAEKGIKNADTVPLKLDSRWVTWHYYIGFKENEISGLEEYFAEQKTDEEMRKKAIIAQEMLFHEAKHYHNNDIDKRCLVWGLTTGLLFLSHASVPKFLLKVGMVAASNITYIRCQELEADRFAFMNVPLEDLEVSKERRFGWAELFEEHTQHSPFTNFSSWGGLSAALLLSRRLHTLNQKEGNQWQKGLIIALVDFLHDYEHPRYWRQAVLVQECIDKRKEENKA
jgi:hypothetical protein